MLKKLFLQAQAQKADVSKGSPLVPEGLLKPAALLELNQDELHVKPAKPAASAKRLLPPSHITPSVPKETKSRNVHLQAIVSSHYLYKSLCMIDSSNCSPCETGKLKFYSAICSKY